MFKINQLVLALILALFVTLPIGAGAQVPGADTRGDIRDARQLMSKERVKLLGDKAILRLTAALNRTDGARERIAFHASEFSNPKFDKTVVDKKLVEVTEAIAKGRTAVAAIKTAMDKALAPSTAGQAGTGTEISFVEVRAKILETIIDIRVAHQGLREVMRLIRAAYPINNYAVPVTTPTPINTTQ